MTAHTQSTPLTASDTGAQSAQQQVSVVPVNQALEPRREPAARWWAVLLGIACLGMAVMGGMGIAHCFNPDIYDPVGHTMTRFANLPKWEAGVPAWTAYTGIALIALGVVLLIVVILPRKRTHYQLSQSPSIWMRPVDVARMASHRVRAIPGIQTAEVTAQRKRLKVTATTLQDAASAETAIRNAVQGICQQQGVEPVISVTTTAVSELSATPASAASVVPSAQEEPSQEVKV